MTTIYGGLLILFMAITGLSLAYCGIETDKTKRRNER